MNGRFPHNDQSTEGAENPAIQLYGRRFYKDQTPVEYLAEFLLVFASPKGAEPEVVNSGAYAFTFGLGDGSLPARYWPEDRIALKLFTFFPISKLDTRHPVHQQAYLDALDQLRTSIDATEEDRDETVRLLQSLFAGFIGVSANRTWATNSFLPVSEALLSRELDWLHSKAIKDKGLTQWLEGKNHFARDRHNFMARGGEVLFLQLAHLFHGGEQSLSLLLDGPSYAHLATRSTASVRGDIESALSKLLCDTTRPVSELAMFVERTLSELNLLDEPKRAPLGWVPTATKPIAALFAIELRNLLTCTLSDLDKIAALQNLCCLQVLRSLSFLAALADNSAVEVDGFIGRYSWVVVGDSAPSGSALRKLSQQSFATMERLLYRVLRIDASPGGSINEADKHGFEIFRALGKKIGLVLPISGPGLRFVLPPPLLHFLVIALIEPGGRIPLDSFYERVFAHYGIALGPRQLAAALAQSEADSTAHHEYAVAADTRWIEETLRQGDFLVELSDAVSIVRNPAARIDDADAPA